MIHRLLALINKEIIQFTRDRVLMAIVLLLPVLQLVMIGGSVGKDVQNMQVAVVDYDLSPLSREIITALDNTDEIIVSYYPDNIEEAQALIEDGTIIGMVVIPRNFMQDTLSMTVTPQIQVVIDGTSSLIAGRTLSATQGAVQSLVSDVAITTNYRRASINVFVQSLFNSSLDLRADSIVSQLALITFEITTLIAVMGFVREREIGTIEMLSITPLKRLELIAGKAITPLIIGGVNFVLMYGVTQIVFDTPMRGSFPLMFGFTLIYLIAEIAFALMMSTLTRSQQQATTMVFVWIISGLAFSGYMVPITSLPKALQWVSWAVPLRHYLAIVRSIMIKGSGFWALLPQAAALLALGVGMMLLTTRTLSRIID